MRTISALKTKHKLLNYICIYIVKALKNRISFFLEKKKNGINKILICLGGADEKTGSTQGSANQRLAFKGSANQNS